MLMMKITLSRPDGVWTQALNFTKLSVAERSIASLKGHLQKNKRNCVLDYSLAYVCIVHI